MRIEFQKPIEVAGDGRMTDTKITHPAFGQIRASRVQGSACLYGSDFSHQHFVTITINKSDLNRSLSRDWAFERGELIEVALSEAQWASFVSTMNASATQCTLQHIQGQPVPGIEPHTTVHETFAREMDETMRKIQSDINAMAAGLDGPIAKTKVAELRKNLESVAHRLTGSTGFVASQFSEHMENTVEKAKIEVNAYVTGAIHRAGLDAMAEKKMITLTGDKE